MGYMELKSNTSTYLWMPHSGLMTVAPYRQWGLQY